MTSAGPQLETLLHRLADCPAEFLHSPQNDNSERIDVVAIVCDQLRQMAVTPEHESQLLDALRKASAAQQSLLAIVSWLLGDAWFISRPQLGAKVLTLYAAEKFDALTKLVKPEKFVHDPDRREELVRVCLHMLGLRPAGESAHEAADRLTTLDSVERDRVLRSTAAAERRAREIREAMAKKKAQEAASRYGE